MNTKKSNTSQVAALNKTAAACALLACSGAALAQSSVTIYGVLDADVGHYRFNGVSKTVQGASGNLPSSLGFRGSEDLGGGYTANFVLESTLVNDIGAGTAAGGLSWNRRSTVSLAGPMGELRLGRDVTSQHWANIVFDPFNALGPGASTNISLGASGNRLSSTNPLVAAFTSNVIEYLYGFAPNAPAGIGRGLYGQLVYSLPENAVGIGRYTGGRIGYSEGPLNVAFAYSESKGPALGTNVGSSNYKDVNLGATYQVGIAKLYGDFGINNTSAAQTKFTHWRVGARIEVGLGYIPLSYNATKQNDAAGTAANQLAVGYVYNLSKRTALYTTASRISNKNGGIDTFSGGNGAPGLVSGGNPGIAGVGTGTGYDLGVRHIF